MDFALVLISALASAVGVSAAAAAMREAFRAGFPVKADQVSEAELDDLIDQAAEPRTTEEPQKQPTSGAKKAAVALVRSYSRDLLGEAGRIAKRAGADHASKAHVRAAAARIGLLRSRAGVMADILLAVGGIGIGAAISYQVNILTGGTPAQDSGVWAAVALGVGVGLFVGGATAKWFKR